MESLWRKETGDVKSGTEMRQTEQHHRDVIVIGAGLAGLLTARYLKDAGMDVLVLEANEIASGQTERTTAKITSQHGLKYSKLIKDVGIRKAGMYAHANEKAIREYERFIRENNIDCQFEKAPAYLYSRQNESLLQEEVRAATLLGVEAFFTRDTELPFEVEGAACFANQAQFSPLKFIQHISDGLEIMEHTKVTAVRGRKVVTESAVLMADKIVVATHYPFINLPGFYFLRQHQERSCVLAVSGCKKIKGMYYSIDPGGLSVRQAGEYLLLGGSSYRTGENEQGGTYEALAETARKYYPECREELRWSAQDCMPHDGIPFIGRYSIFTPHLYVVTGFQKWGMTTAMVAAMILRDKFCGDGNPYEEVFRPQRLHVRAGIGNLCHDVGISVKRLIKGLFHRSKRCPHLGCELTWNPDEESWDCPCHGSRFNKDGKLLDNPAAKRAFTK